MISLSNDTIAINIGQYLKRLREHKNVKLRAFAEKMEYSHGHVSSIENGKKGIPKKEFITKYLNEIANSYEEYNKYVKKINEISEGNLNLEEIQYIDESRVKDSLKKGYLTNSEKSFFNSLDLMAIPFEFNHDVNGQIKMTPYNVPINDFQFHLKDMNNRKFYKKIEITEVDRKNIEMLMDNYFKSKLNIQKNIRKQLAHNTLEIDDLNTLNNEISDKL
ncbi:helix-turn-helix domain-containing protein [Staphylococcus xylosus]|uniref:helix-turn-helix domain-containing protein n=1 Tax=Staphylococcus xylosus TaxID=1288 RepID=UPI00398BAAEE